MKKLWRISLILVLVIGMTGCNNSGTSSSSGGSSSETGEEDRPTISMMTFDFEGSPLTGDYADEVVETMEDYTDTTVDFTFVPSDNYEDKLGLTLASPSDMPMIIAVGTLNASIVSAAEAGAFWDLTDYISDSEAYPNLSQANPNVLESLTIDDQIIGLYRARAIGRNGLGYRADWAEALGLDAPETVDDLYNMLYQFTYGDPDGDGEDDTYGLALCKYTGPLDIMQTYFGVGNGWVEQDGQLVPVHQTEEYMEALNWFKKIYDDGLVYQDWPVRDTSTWADDLKNGECGVYIDTLDGSRRIWDYYVNNDIAPTPNSTSYETAAMNLVGHVNGKTLATSGYNGFFVITKAADTEEKLADCLHFLDKMDDDPMLILSSYGLEGIHWEKDDDGYLVDLDEGDLVSAKAYSALNQTVCYIPNMTPQSIPLQTTERADLCTDVIAENEDYAVYNPASAYIVNSETYSMNGANLDKILDTARTQYIVGEIDEAGLEAAWENWNNQGGTQVIQEVNEQYQN